MNTNSYITVPFMPIDGAQILDCIHNVEKAVAMQGGRAVTGWRVGDERVFHFLQHHAIWQDPDGQYWDVTPQAELYPSGVQLVLRQEPIDFLIDESAEFRLVDGQRKSLLNRYVAKPDSPPGVLRALNYLAQSEKAYFEREDYQSHLYYTGKANAILRPYGVTLYPYPDLTVGIPVYKLRVG